jgi:hypothetical protein
MSDTELRIATIIIASISLIVSFIALYKSALEPFKPYVVPVKRLVLHNVNGTPYVIILCDFINAGAKAGVIDDLKIDISNSSASAKASLYAHLARRELDVYVQKNDQPQPLRDFSSVLLTAHKTLELYVFFSQEVEAFTWVPGTFELVLKYKYEQRTNYNESPVNFTVELTRANIDGWKLGELVKVDSKDLKQIREADQAKHKHRFAWPFAR